MMSPSTSFRNARTITSTTPVPSPKATAASSTAHSARGWSRWRRGARVFAGSGGGCDATMGSELVTATTSTLAQALRVRTGPDPLHAAQPGHRDLSPQMSAEGRQMRCVNRLHGEIHAFRWIRAYVEQLFRTVAVQDVRVLSGEDRIHVAFRIRFLVRRANALLHTPDQSIGRGTR